MKEHGHKKHRRGSRDRDLIDPPPKIPKREPGSHSESRDDQDRHNRRKHHHHDRHRHSVEDSMKDSSRGREERERDRDHERRRHPDRNHVKRRQEDNFKIKDEPIDSDDARDREGPSSSRWDEDEDRRGSRGTGRSSGARNPEGQDSRVSRGFRPEFHDRGGGGRGRGGRGRGGRGGRGRGGGRGGGNSRFLPKDEEDTSNMEWGKKTEDGGTKPLPPEERDKPNFGLSGKLTEDTNTYKGVVIKYSEPPEARVPKRRWRLYPFKGDEALKVLYIHRASAFLLGRERKVVDIPLDHPSCSKQHAALQFRLVHYNRDDGAVGKRIRPYIIDLDSANGTYVNSNKIDPRKYVELLERDVLKFGYSSREYVLLHEHSKDDEEDDNM